VNDLRERLAERHVRQLALFEQGGLQRPGRFTRFHSLALVILVAAFIWTIVVPFYAYGLHLEPSDSVAGGGFDPKGFPIYNSEIGCLLRLFSILVLMIAPLWISIFGSLLGFTVVRFWAVLDIQQRRYGLAATSLGFGLLAFSFSPYGRVILGWFMD